VLDVASSADFEYGADGTLFLKGAINFDTVDRLHREIKFQKPVKSIVRIDWSQVDKVDSSGVALCLTWIETAHESGLKVHFLDLPEQMLQLIRVNQVGELFD